MVADTPFPELVLEVVLEVVLPRTEAEAVSVRVLSNLVAQKRKRADSQTVYDLGLETTMERIFYGAMFWTQIFYGEIESSMGK